MSILVALSTMNNQKPAMSDLVHGFFLCAVERTVLLHGMLFEEKPDLVPRRQKVVVADMPFLFAGFRGEFRLPMSIGMEITTNSGNGPQDVNANRNC